MSRDRFEAMVEKHELEMQGVIVVYAGVTEKLLRREHAALVRAVRRLQRESNDLPDPQYTNEEVRGYKHACEDVLALLAKRKRRTR